MLAGEYTWVTFGQSRLAPQKQNNITRFSRDLVASSSIVADCPSKLNKTHEKHEKPFL